MRKTPCYVLYSFELAGRNVKDTQLLTVPAGTSRRVRAFVRKGLTLVSWGGRDALPQSGKRGPTQVRVLTVPEARSPEPRCWQDQFLLGSPGRGARLVQASSGPGVVPGLRLLRPGAEQQSLPPSSRGCLAAGGGGPISLSPP